MPPTYKLGMESQNLKSEVQSLRHGAGDLFHRRYFVEFKDSKHSIDQLMDLLKKDINRFSPQVIAKFEKKRGDEHELRVGDEFHIALSGPWDAPVRVNEVKDRSFSLITLEGHPEAGEIEFRLDELPKGEIRFEIESFARSRDGLVNFLYDTIPVVRMAQTTMWVLFCESFVRHATGELAEKMGVITERYDVETDEWARE